MILMVLMQMVVMVLMNKRQLIVQRQFVKNEKAVLKELKHEYAKALAEIKIKIQILQSKPETQSRIYQLTYQFALQDQLTKILEKMRSNNYQSVRKYLDECYKEGFAGAMFDLQGQGVPFAFPIDQTQMTKAVQLDSKIRHGLYANMGLNVNELKKNISSEITRGLARQEPYEQIAVRLSRHIQGDYNKSMRIVRTEGHRIQNQSALDAMTKAVEVGAEVLKQWDATLDDKTRETHVELDGMVVGVDEPFVIPSTGAEAMYAGGFGDPAEDCNCRCCILQRASWNMDDYDASKMDNMSGQLVHFKEKNYQDFKDSYFGSFE